MAIQSTSCDQRDGYVGKWLTEDERIAFESHVVNCPDCRQFIREQGRLHELLVRSDASLVSVPSGLIDQIEGRLRRARRRRAAAWATGLAAAGFLVCFLGTWLFPDRAPKEASAVALPPPQPEPALDPRSLVEVTFPPSSDVIGVPQRTENSSVTIIWVYPTIKVAQDPTPAPDESFQPPERKGI
jgi:hypothetical protein